MTLRYRPLKWGDSGFCRALASDPAVRAVSLNPEPPTFWGHLRWMSRRIGGGLAWLIFELLPLGGPLHRPTVADERCWARVGLLRAASLPGGGCEVSIALLASARGRGIGTRALRELTPRVVAEAGAPAYARIRIGNAASIVAFRQAGYTVPSEPDWTRVSRGQHGIYVLRWPPEENHGD